MSQGESVKLFGTRPVNEDARLLALELYDLLTPENKGKIEIEGRVGVLLDKSSDNRWKFPISSETLLSSKCEQFKFVPYLSVEIFQHLNVYLNDKVNKSPKDVTYKRTKEIDRFYKKRDTGDKIRVSLDPQSMQPIRAILKDKKKNFDFLCPQSLFDFRVTVSLENTVEFKTDDDNVVPQMERVKDRLSYQFDIWTIDITSVSEYSLDQFEVRREEVPRVTYEVEMEVNPDVFFAEKTKIQYGSSFEGFAKYCDEILLNMKTLIKKSELPPPPRQVPLQQKPQMTPGSTGKIPIVKHTPLIRKREEK